MILLSAAALGRSGGGAGPAPIAFFDVDGTVITVRSLLSFLDFLRGRCGWDQEPWFARYHAELGRLVTEGAPRARLNAFYYTLFRGRRADAVAALGEAWFAELRTAAGFFNQGVVRELQAHRERGAAAVLVTGSFPPVVDPIARALECDAALCTRLEVADGCYTGALVGEPCVGPAKAVEVTRFASARGVPLERCHAYGDDDGDAAMLAVVGHGRLVDSGPDYRSELARRDWRLPARHGGDGRGGARWTP